MRKKLLWKHQGVIKKEKKIELSIQLGLDIALSLHLYLTIVPNVSDGEDKKGKNTIDGELVPVV